MKRKDDYFQYTCIYIKHVRQHNYHGSLYSFVRMFETDLSFCNQSYKIMNELLRQHYLERTSRQTYRWNHQGKFILMGQLRNLVNQSI